MCGRAFNTTVSPFSLFLYLLTFFSSSYIPLFYDALTILPFIWTKQAILCQSLDERAYNDHT